MSSKQQEPDAPDPAGRPAPAAGPGAAPDPDELEELRLLLSGPPDPPEEAPPRRPKPGAGTSRRRRRVPRFLAAGAVVGLALLTAAAIAAAVVKAQEEEVRAAGQAADFTPSAAATPRSAATGLVVTVIGDGTVSDAPSGVPASGRWVARLQRALPGTVTEAAVTGAGYAAGPAGGGFADQAAAVPDDADVVVFFGGAADASTSSLTLARAATGAYSTAARRAPGAAIVVVGPVLAGDVPVEDLARLRSVLRSSARLAGATWVDPIGAGWLTSTGPAETAPSSADEQTIAARMRTVVTAALTR